MRRIRSARAEAPLSQPRGGIEISSKENRVNEAIAASEVRLIDEAGQQLGVFPIREALRMAQERGTDLVEVAPGAKPPVCRLLNYGKFLYERTKKERLARKNQRIVDIKEIWMHPKIGAHDVDFKSKRIREFLGDDNKVRLRVRFRGREASRPDLGRLLLERVVAKLMDCAIVEQAPTIEEGAKSMYVLLAPRPGIARRENVPAPTEAAVPAE
jgi:translation initiation factor IF-3